MTTDQAKKIALDKADRHEPEEFNRAASFMALLQDPAMLQLCQLKQAISEGSIHLLLDIGN